MQYKHNQPRPDRAGDEAPADGIIEGRNAVIEALRAGTQIDKIFIMKGEVDTALGHIASTARSQGIVVADAVSGVTGAGKKATERTHFCFADENLEAYGVCAHRHTP